MSLDSKILVTGVNGQLGYDVCRELKERGYTNFKGIDIADLDITDEDAVNKYILEYRPDIVIHNAAWTAVDKAEDMKDKVYAVNALGSKYIAQACKKVNAKMVFISTDYVFPGDGDKFYEVDDEKGALGVYGLTKSQGEDFVKGNLDKDNLFRTTKKLDTSYEYKDIRLRINISLSEGVPIFTFRLIKKELPKYSELGVTDIVRRMTMQP